MRARSGARTGGAHAVDEVGREAEGHQLGRVQEAPLLKRDAQVDVHHLGHTARTFLPIGNAHQQDTDSVLYR